MKLAINIVNAFSKGAFTGNPAAVIVTDTPLPESMMQSIAAQNNLAETAFVVTNCEPYPLRWFTPIKEVDLCGHATLAVAKVLFDQGVKKDLLRFSSLSGELGVRKINSALELDFPARPAGLNTDADKVSIANAIGCKASAINECLIANWCVVVVECEQTVRQLQPDFAAIAELHPFALMVTAKGTDCDFVARFFAPNAGINEDPVTGSAYTTLAPYWAERLGKNTLSARQLSTRGGWLECDVGEKRVRIRGQVEPYLSGEIEIR